MIQNEQKIVSENKCVELIFEISRQKVEASPSARRASRCCCCHLYQALAKFLTVWRD